MKKYHTYKILMISILSAISFILMLISIPLPFFPPFLKFDIGDLPAYIGFAVFGGGVGVLIIFINIIIYSFIVSSEQIRLIKLLLSSFNYLLTIYLVYIGMKITIF